ncbi:MAG TPA: LacI family DNA-binding transcriptional regulator [Capsulimonadaceae bacterium]|jgi:LacI family transcriptional regulator
MATTLKQIAEILNLDYSTVSYALSGKGSINEATRQRVREAADELGYIPNGLARRMRAKQTHSLGIVLPDSILNYNEIIQQIYRCAIGRGYEMQITLTEFDEHAEDRAIRSLLESRLDGIIVRSRYGTWDEVPQGAALRQAAAQQIPVVIYGKTMTGSPFPSFARPLAANAVKVVGHLLDLGHRNIAVLLPVPGDRYNYPHQSTVDGARQAYTQRGIDPMQLAVQNLDQDAPAPIDGFDASYGNYLDESLPRRALARGRILLESALRMSPTPTAVVAYNEITGIGACLEANRLGLQVPTDISVVAVTRGLAADLAPQPMTTCDALPREVAEAALDLLVETIAGTADASTIRMVEPFLYIGTTTSVPITPQ